MAGTTTSRSVACADPIFAAGSVPALALPACTAHLTGVHWPVALIWVNAYGPDWS